MSRSIWKVVPKTRATSILCVLRQRCRAAPFEDVGLLAKTGVRYETGYPRAFNTTMVGLHPDDAPEGDVFADGEHFFRHTIVRHAAQVRTTHRVYRSVTAIPSCSQFSVGKIVCGVPVEFMSVFHRLNTNIRPTRACLVESMRIALADPYASVFETDPCALAFQTEPHAFMFLKQFYESFGQK